MAMSFSLQIAAWVEKTKVDLDKVVRYAALAIDGKLLYRSPVGDPTKWKVNPNKPKVFGKFSAAGPKSGWQAGFMSKGASTYRTSGAGYVGGRFRGAWMFSIGSPSSEQGTVLDPTGKITLEAHKALIAAAKAGDVLYFQNNMPYAKRLEQGWSQQAPLGMVALTITEWQSIVDGAASSVRAGGVPPP